MKKLLFAFASVILITACTKDTPEDSIDPNYYNPIEGTWELETPSSTRVIDTYTKDFVCYSKAISETNETILSYRYVINKTELTLHLLPDLRFFVYTYKILDDKLYLTTEDGSEQVFIRIGN